MQIESLKLICDVARFRSFSRAATANNVTQSAASQVVSHVEKRLGVMLIDRSTRPLRLTKIGDQYVRGCRRVVDDYFRLEDAITEGTKAAPQVVRVAAIYSVGLRDMTHHIEEFRRMAGDNSDVDISYAHPNRVYEHVADGTADLGIVSFPRSLRGICADPWRDEPMVLVCAAEHALASKRQASPGDLDGLDYVGFDRELDIRRHIDRYLREGGATPNVVLEFDNIENIKQAVEIDAGVALLPQPTVQREVDAGRLVSIPLNGEGMARPLVLIHRGQHMAPLAARFVDVLRDETPRGRRGRKRTSDSPAHQTRR